MEDVKQLQAVVRTLQGDKDRAVKKTNSRVEELEKKIDNLQSEVEELKELIQQIVSMYANRQTT